MINTLYLLLCSTDVFYYRFSLLVSFTSFYGHRKVISLPDTSTLSLFDMIFESMKFILSRKKRKSVKRSRWSVGTLMIH